MKRSLKTGIAILVFPLFGSALVFAQPPDEKDKASADLASPPTTTTAPATPPEKDIWTRDKLTGDWFGLRTDLAKIGINIDVRLTQFYQGVAYGGVNTNFAYGGTMDFIINIDTHKIGLWEGGLLNMHARKRFGSDVLSDAGGLTLLNGPLLFPEPGDYHGTEITGLTLYQSLFDGRVSAFVGKLDAFDLVSGLFPNTIDGGLTGFLNPNASVTALPWLRWINLSLWGAGIWTVHESGMPETGIMVLGQENTATTWSFRDSFDDGVGILAFHRFFYDIDHKPGYVFIGGGGSTKKYPSLAPNDWLDVPGTGPTDTKKKNPWAVAIYVSQVLWQDAVNDKRRVQSMIGGSVGDDNPSFSNWNIFGNIESLGPFASRAGDRVGIAYWYNGLGGDFKDLVSDQGIPLRDLWGVEVYYNFEITPWFHVTPDLQILQNEFDGDNTAIVVGVRAVMDL